MNFARTYFGYLFETGNSFQNQFEMLYSKVIKGDFTFEKTGAFVSYSVFLESWN